MHVIASRITTEPVPSWSCSQAVNKPVWHIPLLFVQWKTHDDGQRNCPNHVEFYSINKFEKLMHLDGFIIRTYHDARRSERQISFTYPCLIHRSLREDSIITCLPSSSVCPTWCCYCLVDGCATRWFDLCHREEFKLFTGRAIKVEFLFPSMFGQYLGPTQHPIPRMANAFPPR